MDLFKYASLWIFCRLLRLSHVDVIDTVFTLTRDTAGNLDETLELDLASQGHMPQGGWTMLNFLGGGIFKFLTDHVEMGCTHSILSILGPGCV